MNEQQQFKKYDFFAVLAVLGVLLILAFESFFVFEAYNREVPWLANILPAAPMPEPVPPAVSNSVPGAVETNAPAAETNVPALEHSAEEAAPVG